MDLGHEVTEEWRTLQNGEFHYFILFIKCY